MKIMLAAAALVILILPTSGHAQMASGAPATHSGAVAVPGPAEGLLDGSELSDWTAPYPQIESFCGDDIVSSHICQPGVNFSQAMADRMCQSYRAGHLPDIKVAPGGFLTIDGLDMLHFCDNFFPLSTGTSCQLGGAACELSAPAPLGSACECNTLQFGRVTGTVVKQ